MKILSGFLTYKLDQSESSKDDSCGDVFSSDPDKNAVVQVEF